MSTKTSLHLLALFALMVAHSIGRDPLASSQALTFSESVGSIPYRLFEPANIIADSQIPLILYLHGAGVQGTNNTSQVTVNVQNLIDHTETGSSAAYLIAPQAPANHDWTGTTLKLALDLVENFAATHNVDATRIYITGLSKGGFGTYAAIADRPGLFAAAVPISSGGGTALAATYAMTPLWAFHGASDTTVSVTNDRITITAIQNAGGTLERYTELAGQNHSIWGPIYNGNSYTYDTNYTGTYIPDATDNMYSWMFAQRAVPEPEAGLMLLASITMFAIRRRRSVYLPTSPH